MARWLLALALALKVQGDAGECAATGSCNAGASGAKRQHYWPMQKGTPQRTGHSPYAMPNTSAPSWVFQTPGWDVVRATPLIDDQLNIYVSTIPGRVYKLSSEGELLWSYYCGEKGNLPGVGVLYDDRLFLKTGKGMLIALNIDTGAEVWVTKVGELTDSTSDCMLISQGMLILAVMDPVPVEITIGVKQRFDYDNNRVLGVRASDGVLQWKFTPKQTVYNFQASTENDGSFVFQDITGSVYRLSLEGKLLWYAGEMDRRSATTAAAVISGGKVYAVSNMRGGMKPGLSEGRGLIHVYDYESGEQLWYQELPYEGNQAVAVGKLAGREGVSIVIGMGKNPGLGWYHYISMVLPRWMIPFTHPIYLLSLRYPHWFSSPQGRAIVAFGAEKGELQWWHEMTPYHKPACEGDNEKFLDRYKDWTNNPNNEPICLPDANSQPVIDGAGTAFVAFQDGHLYAVRDENGDGLISAEEVQKHKVGDAFQASLAMAPKTLALVDCSGRLEVFRG